MKRHYFAYGSNMDREQMSNRCPGSHLIGTALIRGYRFIINNRGVATVSPAATYNVHGVLWQITPQDEQSLDNNEGVKFGTYYKTDVLVQEVGGIEVAALIYIAADSQPGTPRAGYMEKILKAAVSHHLSEDYLNELKAWLRSN